LTIVVPADSLQAEAAIHATAGLPGPIYYSLGKDDRLRVPGLGSSFRLGRLEIAREGNDVAILAMGSVTVEATTAAATLSAQGIEATVAVVSSFNPDPAQDVADLLHKFPCAVTVEAQTISGGL